MGPSGAFGALSPREQACSRAQSGPPLPPTGAVPAHHHPHHERRGQALWLPLGLPHLPVFLHDDAGHPLLKLLHSGMFSNKQEVYNLAVANGNRFSPLGSFSPCFPPFTEISWICVTIHSV